MDAGKTPGPTKDTGFKTNARKTVAGNHLDVWDFLFSENGLAQWLGPIDPDDLVLRKEFTLDNSVTLKITEFEPYSHLRMSWKKTGWTNSSQLQLRVIPSGEKKTEIEFHQEMLSGTGQQEQMMQQWEEILSSLEGAMQQ